MKLLQTLVTWALNALTAFLIVLMGIPLGALVLLATIRERVRRHYDPQGPRILK